MGGPPVIAYTTARRLSPATFKAVLQGFFAVNTAAMLGMLAFAGMITTETLTWNLWFSPMIPLGIWLGARYGDKLQPSVFRRAVLAALLGLGVLYAVRGA